MRKLNFTYNLKVVFPYGIWSGGTAGPVRFPTYEEAFKQQVTEIKFYFHKKNSLDYSEFKNKLNSEEVKLVDLIVEQLKDESPHLGI